MSDRPASALPLAALFLAIGIAAAGFFTSRTPNDVNRRLVERDSD